MKNTQLTKHPGGRPTDYHPETIIPKTVEYLEVVNQNELPSIEGLALFLDVSRDTLYEWSSKHPEFSDTIKKILMKQKKQLIDDGMYGGKEVNAAMAIFLLKANHGLKEDSGVQVNQQINVGSNDKKENTITFINFKNEPEG